MTADKVSRTWFSDDKVFTVQMPTNTQNDRVYVAVSVKRDVPPERLLKGESTSLHSSNKQGDLSQ